MLADLAEEIKTALEAALATLKTGFTTQVILDLPIKNALDPDSCLENNETGLFICPVVNNYAIDQSPRRGKIKQLVNKPVVSMIMLLGFTEVEKGDVAPWEESKEVINFREKVEKWIIMRQWTNGQMESALSEPPMEVTLGNRRFLGITEFTFDDVSC